MSFVKALTYKIVYFSTIKKLFHLIFLNYKIFFKRFYLKNSVFVSEYVHMNAGAYTEQRYEIRELALIGCELEVGY